MVAKKSIPAWSFILVVALVLGLVAAFYMMSNPGSVSRETLINLRMRPGGAHPAPAASTYGMARGVPIIHSTGNNASDPRQRPQG